jgi:nucleoside 2-deoxyribosyltransferase
VALIVVGGMYVERCLAPHRLSLMGSGGRAAAALANLSPGTVLHTFHPAAMQDDATLAMAGYGVEVVCHPSDGVVGFEYHHPLSFPRIYPVPLPRAETVTVEGDVLLRFGCLEGDFRVDARLATYDPQSGTRPELFRANGSRAEVLAIVLNRVEAALLTGSDDPLSAAAALQESQGASIVVVKMGAAGAQVFDGKTVSHVPAYSSMAVDKIGSGDVFSAAFAHFWGERGLSPAEATDVASRYTSQYVADRRLPLMLEPPTMLEKATSVDGARIYLGGAFFTTPQVWLIEEARNGLLSLGADVFSPMHDVGFGAPQDIARRDLDGLDGCSAMLALLAEPDPGTLFEVGYARSRGVPVVAFVQQPRHQDTTMLIGTGCEIVDDFATALYRVMWASSG